MPIIIAFETAFEIASVSLLLENGEITTRRSKGVANHSQFLLPMIQSVLGEANIRLSDCDAIAFGCGPGSFTGIRTACGVAQGLAFGSQLPLVPIVSLLAMAQSCYLQHGSKEVLAILDARMKEVYWAQYALENGIWKTVVAPQVTPPEAVLPVGVPVACGNGLAVYQEAFLGLAVQNRYEAIIPDSEAAARLGLEAYLRNETISVYEIEPLYLRDKVAYTTKERQAMKAGSQP